MKNSAFDGTQGRLSTERHPFFPQESALFQHPLPHLGERRCAARPGRLPSGGPPMFASHHTAAARGPPPGQSSASRASPLPSQPSGRARAPTPRAAPHGPAASPGAVEGGGGRRYRLISPAATIYLAGEPALPGLPPPAPRFQRSGWRATERSPRPAAATPLQLPQSLALEAAILAPAARPPSRRRRRQTRARHGTRSADILLPTPPPHRLAWSVKPPLPPSSRPLLCPTGNRQEGERDLCSCARFRSLSPQSQRVGGTVRARAWLAEGGRL